MTRSHVCHWREGSRTACPVLIDNLSIWEVDLLWGEISSINWKRMVEDGEMLEIPKVVPTAILRAPPAKNKRRPRPSMQTA